MKTVSDRMRRVAEAADSIIHAEETHGMTSFETIQWVADSEGGLSLEEIDAISLFISENDDEQIRFWKVY